jgi:DNA invertase Pin-like site-specific DNA recombinase
MSKSGINGSSSNNVTNNDITNSSNTNNSNSNSTITGSKKKVYGYTRVSTVYQVEKGGGLESQEESIRKYCEANGLELVYLFSDRGISGTAGEEAEVIEDLTKRKDLLRMLASIDSEVNTIVVAHTSRLWRDETAKLIIKREIKKVNGDVISVAESSYNIYDSDPVNYLMNAILEAFDVYERMKVTMEFSKGITKKAMKGHKSTGRQPFGYEYDKGNGKVTVVNENQAKVVRDVFELRGEGGISLQGIADVLNEEAGLKGTGTGTAAEEEGSNLVYFGNNANRVWNKVAIKQMLDNDYYLGILTYKGEKMRGQHEGIVGVELWDKVHGEGSAEKVIGKLQGQTNSQDSSLSA